MKLKGVKISGDGRGKKLGYPTINLKCSESVALDNGVYAVWASPLSNSSKFRGVMHYGQRPTFKSDELRIELHLMDEVDETIYELNDWEVEIVELLRPVMKFDNVDELIGQIEKDIGRGKALMVDFPANV